MWKRGQDDTGWGLQLSRNLCFADCFGSPRGATAEVLVRRDELGQVYKGLRLVAIYEGKWRGVCAASG